MPDPHCRVDVARAAVATWHSASSILDDAPCRRTMVRELVSALALHIAGEDYAEREIEADVTEPCGEPCMIG
ncbi:hypothetical protein G3O06_03245 [Burkholderia sp. Ac-20345]|uniref:hypothetical protein n=1 Tax=Burkholderia sp. Ac-20345 TaxID=2703891 RepID=UPI00197C0995|nr:hypothetical protein [Burkholderia sp. Ac-20345]MBN3776580.1 hypothetical protein [Burkholderia sp. Ac-20345]